MRENPENFIFTVTENEFNFDYKIFLLFYRATRNACETFLVSKRNKETHREFTENREAENGREFFLFLSSMRKRGIYMYAFAIKGSFAASFFP